jgi:hypothetical protein
VTQHPFSTGSQFADWLDRNCERCVKYEPEGAAGACSIDAALLTAQITDGSVPDEIAERLGYEPDKNYYTWYCPERVLSPKALARE